MLFSKTSKYFEQISLPMGDCVLCMKQSDKAFIRVVPCFVLATRYYRLDRLVNFAHNLGKLNEMSNIMVLIASNDRKFLDVFLILIIK